MDVCCEVVESLLNGKVIVRWINMGYVNSYYIKRASKELIQIENTSDWEKCLDPYTKCLRYAKWGSL
jgi:hypothetical protein